MNRVASVTLIFLSEDRFVSATVEGYFCLEAAMALLELEPQLAVRGDEVWIVTCNGPIQALSIEDDDAIGRWPPGADRSSEEVYFDAHVPVEAFLDGYGHTRDLRLVRFAAQEWNQDRDGRCVGPTKLKRGEIGRLEHS